MAPGDGLLLYTDGHSEGRDPEDRELGVEGLQALLSGCRGFSPSEMVGACLSAVEGHRQGARPHDDLAILALRRETA